MEENVKSLNDYLIILRRHKWPMIFASSALLMLSVLVAFVLPPVYQSMATILIEEQEIPQELVRSTVTSYADQRIQVISQRVMTRVNLERIVEKFNLYSKERATEPGEVVLQQLRDHVKLSTVSAEVRDPRSGRASEATIAFTLAFEGDNPEVVQRVTNELASLYLNENIKTRREQAAEASNFFSEEAARLVQEISTLEAQLATFKQQNSGSLPEVSQVNMQMLERTDRELLELDRQVSALEERKIFLEAELAKARASETVINSVGGRGVATPAERLRGLEAEYLSAQAAYAPEHPDVLRLGREIDALRVQVGNADAHIALETQLAATRKALQQARGKYSPKHPDVVRLQGEVVSIEKSLTQLPQSEGSAVSASDSAVVVTLRAQLESVKVDLHTTVTQREALKARFENYEQRLNAAPEVERGYRALTRDYEAALAKYQDIRAKQTQAQAAQQLEQDRKGERFTLLEPPQLPAEPIKPNRPAILFLGLVLAMAGGMGLTAALEALDRRVHGPRAVTRLLQEAPLAVIPYIENHTDRRRRHRRYTRAGVASVTGMIIVLVVVHYYWMPLDMAWLSFQRRVVDIIGLA